MDFQLGLQRRTDAAGRAHFFQLLGDARAKFADFLPFSEQIGIRHFRPGMPQMEKHAVVLCIAIEIRPGLFCGKAENRRHQLEQAVRDMPQRALRGTACAGIAARGVEAILKDV